MRNEADYASESIRKGFRALLEEAAGQQAVQKLLVPVTEPEKALAGFLESLGFEHAGNEREALYLHGGYRDVHVYAARIANE